MKKYVFLLLIPLFFACKGEQGMEITVDEIDAYVEQKLSDSEMYDVSQSLRFSHENETYEVVKFMQNDTVVLFMETVSNVDEQVLRQVFYMHGKPVFVDEVIARNTEVAPFTQRKVYLDGSQVIESYERTGSMESELQFVDYEPASVAEDEYDFGKAERAMAQKGEFELLYEEIMQVGDQRYLILENPESKFDVALFIAEPTTFLVDLEVNTATYKGRPLFVTHQFILMSGVERMLYMDAYFADENP